MKKGTKVTFAVGGKVRAGTVTGAMPNGMIDIRFDDAPHRIERRAQELLQVVARANPRARRNSSLARRNTDMDEARAWLKEQEAWLRRNKGRARARAELLRRQSDVRVAKRSEDELLRVWRGRIPRDAMAWKKQNLVRLDREIKKERLAQGAVRGGRRQEIQTEIEALYQRRQRLEDLEGESLILAYREVKKAEARERVSRAPQIQAPLGPGIPEEARRRRRSDEIRRERRSRARKEDEEEEAPREPVPPLTDEESGELEELLSLYGSALEQPLSTFIAVPKKDTMLPTTKARLSGFGAFKEAKEGDAGVPEDIRNLFGIGNKLEVPTLLDWVELSAHSPLAPELREIDDPTSRYGLFSRGMRRRALSILREMRRVVLKKRADEEDDEQDKAADEARKKRKRAARKETDPAVLQALVPTMTAEEIVDVNRYRRGKGLELLPVPARLGEAVERVTAQQKRADALRERAEEEKQRQRAIAEAMRRRQAESAVSRTYAPLGKQPITTTDIQQAMRGGATLFARQDPPRVSEGDPGERSFCGNPIDQTAYYIAVDNKESTTTSFLRWDTVEKALTDRVDAVNQARENQEEAPIDYVLPPRYNLFQTTIKRGMALSTLIGDSILPLIEADWNAGRALAPKVKQTLLAACVFQVNGAFVNPIEAEKIKRFDLRRNSQVRVEIPTKSWVNAISAFVQQGLPEFGTYRSGQMVIPPYMETVGNRRGSTVYRSTPRDRLMFRRGARGKVKQRALSEDEAADVPRAKESTQEADPRYDVFTIDRGSASNVERRARKSLGVQEDADQVIYFRQVTRKRKAERLRLMSPYSYRPVVLPPETDADRRSPFGTLASRISRGSENTISPEVAYWLTLSGGVTARFDGVPQALLPSCYTRKDPEGNVFSYAAGLRVNINYPFKNQSPFFSWVPTDVALDSFTPMSDREQVADEQLASLEDALLAAKFATRAAQEQRQEAEELYLRRRRRQRRAKKAGLPRWEDSPEKEEADQAVEAAKRRYADRKATRDEYRQKLLARMGRRKSKGYSFSPCLPPVGREVQQSLITLRRVFRQYLQSLRRIRNLFRRLANNPQALRIDRKVRTRTRFDYRSGEQVEDYKNLGDIRIALSSLASSLAAIQRTIGRLQRAKDTTGSVPASQVLAFFNQELAKNPTLDASIKSQMAADLVSPSRFTGQDDTEEALATARMVEAYGAAMSKASFDKTLAYLAVPYMNRAKSTVMTSVRGMGDLYWPRTSAIYMLLSGNPKNPMWAGESIPFDEWNKAKRYDAATAGLTRYFAAMGLPHDITRQLPFSERKENWISKSFAPGQTAKLASGPGADDAFAVAVALRVGTEWQGIITKFLREQDEQLKDQERVANAGFLSAVEAVRLILLGEIYQKLDGPALAGTLWGDDQGNEDIQRVVEALDEEIVKLQGGTVSLSKTGNYTVYKTYNPALFEYTRRYWNAKGPSVLLRPKTVLSIDVIGRYGVALEAMQKPVATGQARSETELLAILRNQLVGGWTGKWQQVVLNREAPKKRGSPGRKLPTNEASPYRLFRLAWPIDVQLWRSGEIREENIEPKCRDARHTRLRALKQQEAFQAYEEWITNPLAYLGALKSGNRLFPGAEEALSRSYIPPARRDGPPAPGPETLGYLGRGAAYPEGSVLARREAQTTGAGGTLERIRQLDRTIGHIGRGELGDLTEEESSALPSRLTALFDEIDTKQLVARSRELTAAALKALEGDE